MPELKGKLDGISIRVPTPNVSLVDFKFVAKRATTRRGGQRRRSRRAADGRAQGHPRRTPTSRWSRPTSTTTRTRRTFALDQTKVIDGKFVRVLAWYDNEWGFSNRMADTAVAMGKLI